jgi:hypothetical protein
MSMVIRGAAALLADTAGVTLTSEVPLPVTLTHFIATSENEHVQLSWVTESELENLGFVIERRSSYDQLWTIVACYLDDINLIGQGNSTVRTEYNFADTCIEFGHHYEYRLSEVDFSGKISPLKNTSVLYQGSKLNNKFIINENAYPNPFNPLLAIDYELPLEAKVMISVFDVNGRPLEQLTNNNIQQIGKHHLGWNAEKYSSGLYLLQLNASFDDGSKSTKVIKLILEK